MSSRTKPIRVDEHDDGVARVVYVHKKIPRDQYKKRPEDLRELADTINRLTGRQDEPEEWLRYIQNQQKAKPRLIRQGREPWPTFEGGHQKSPALSGLLDEEQMEALRESYMVIVLPLKLGTDAAAWNEDVVAALAAEFTRRTSMIIPGMILMAIVEEKRKRQLWFRVTDHHQSRGRGFSDLDDLDTLDEVSEE